MVLLVLVINFFSKDIEFANVSFIKMEKAEVCLDITKHRMGKKQRVSGSKTERRRFKSKTHGKYVPGGVLEIFLIPRYKRSPKDAESLCFRLNGELAPIPQNEEENNILDKTIWDYMTKRAANNITSIIANGDGLTVWVAGESILEDQDKNISPNSKELVYPPKGDLKWRHPWTGSPLKAYKDGYILPQSCPYTSFSKMCLQFFNSMKKPIKGNFWYDRLDPLVRAEPCTATSDAPFVCMFSTEPTFRIRGL